MVQINIKQNKSTVYKIGHCWVLSFHHWKVIRRYILCTNINNNSGWKIQLIKQARKSLLFTDENIWMKKGKMLYLMLQWGHKIVLRSVRLLVFTYLESYKTSSTRKKSVYIKMTGCMSLKMLTDLNCFFSHNEGLKITIVSTQI